MYESILDYYIMGAEYAETRPIEGYGIQVYINTNPDDIGPDFYIDPLDTEGIKLFREWAAKMAPHYKSLKK